MSFGMHDLKLQGKGRTPRAPWTSGARALIATSYFFLFLSVRVEGQSLTYPLPDAPSALLIEAKNSTALTPQPFEQQSTSLSESQGTKPTPTTTVPLQVALPSATLPPCPKSKQRRRFPIIFTPSTQSSCADPLQFIVDTGFVTPLSVRQKGVLATRDVTDPFNLMTIGFFSAITVASNAHSYYGPGFAGWGRESGYSLAEDIQIEFTGTFLIPSLTHEDPRYHRMPQASVSRRIKHALIHTLVSQHDDGSLMPNYATLINYPLSAEISNLYVPDIGTNAPSTAKRVIAGFATDPIGPLVAEFLPDVAKRVHIHIIFVQQILNHMAPGAGEGSSSF